jgi:purine nucleoside permease
MVEVGLRDENGDHEREVFRQNERLIRETLLDGVLSSNSIIDRSAIETYLAHFAAGRANADPAVLETFFNVEVWFRTWRSVLDGIPSS